MLSSQEPQEPEKKKKKKEVPVKVVKDTTRNVVQRDTILVEQRQLTNELKDLVEAKKKKLEEDQ